MQIYDWACGNWMVHVLTTTTTTRSRTLTQPFMMQQPATTATTTRVTIVDLLWVSEHPDNVMKALGEFYELKDRSVKEPDIYLGADIEMVQLPDGRSQCAMLSRTYVKNSVKVVDNLLVKDGIGLHLKSTARSPFPSGYMPELDVTKELDKAMASRFMHLIGTLRWAIKLGHIYIYTEVSQLSQHQALPSERRTFGSI
jgi:hypothetical protein